MPASQLLKFTLGISFVAMTAACTKPTSWRDSFIPSRESFETVFAEAQLKCEDPSNCPSNVGLIVIAAKAANGSPGFSQCTGTLVGENLVITASHCIPTNLKKNKQTSCSDSLGFVRVSADRFPQKSRCAQVLEFSDEDEPDQIDYAFFTLENKQTDQPYKLSRQGFPDQTAVYTYTSDPFSQRSVGGVLKRKNCQTVMNSWISLKYVDPLSFTMSLLGENCQLIGGNSGSSVFVNEQVRGVVSLGRKYAEDLVLINGVDTYLGGGVNLACLPLTAARGLVSPISPSCTSVSRSSPDDEVWTPAGVQRYARPALQSLVAQSPLFRYSATPTRIKNIGYAKQIAKSGETNRVEVQFSMTPTCVLPLNEWKKFGADPSQFDQRSTITISHPLETTILIFARLDAFARPINSSRTIGRPSVNERTHRFSEFGTTIPWCNDSTQAPFKEAFLL